MATILVAYVSKSGSTAEIAGWIGEALTATGATVQVRPADEVDDLEGVDAVVIGGPLYMGRVLGPVPAFFSRHRDTLGGRPVALFLSGTSLGGDDPGGEEKGRAIAEAARSGVPLAAVGLFGGVFSVRNVPIVGRFIRGGEVKDTRDRNAIASWADALPARFGL